ISRAPSSRTTTLSPRARCWPPFPPSWSTSPSRSTSCGDSRWAQRKADTRDIRNVSYRDIAEARVGRRTLIYEHGWQSWSPTGVYTTTATSPRAPTTRSQTMHYRPGKPVPRDGFQGEGLLAVGSGDEGTVRIWSAPDPSREVPSIRTRALDGRLVVSAGGRAAGTSYRGGLYAALGAWRAELPAL